MQTLHTLASMPDKTDVKIIDGTLDRMLGVAVQLEQRVKLSRKRKKTMSTTQTSPTENKLVLSEDTGFGFKLKPNGVHSASKRVFNLETLEKETKSQDYTVKNLTNAKELTDIKSDLLLALVNLGLQKKALMEAKAKIGGSNAKAVNDFINGFRFLPNFSALGAQDGDPADKKSAARKNQTVQIMAFIKNVPTLYDQLKQMAADANEADDDEEEES